MSSEKEYPVPQASAHSDSVFYDGRAKDTPIRYFDKSPIPEDTLDFPGPQITESLPWEAYKKEGLLWFYA
jgi:hypothetical protein